MGKKLTCLYCNREFVHRHNKKYCNNQCQSDHAYQIYINDWLAGAQNGDRGEYQLSYHIRKFLFKKYNNACARCGWSAVNPYTNRIPLEVEHIDGDYKNNTETNLILLCPNCHSLTATYKGANLGRGRMKRKKYSLYADSKPVEQVEVDVCKSMMWRDPVAAGGSPAYTTIKEDV